MDCCCHGGASSAPPESPLPSSDTKPRSWLRQSVALVQWAIPLGTLALVPKCPACVAAYVFLFTGIGLSFQTAAVLRWGLILLSILPLAYLVFRAARRAIVPALHLAASARSNGLR
jgi:hypothetical protein